ncbi:MAG TPA: pyruvate dehydrogenase (acetyl-transferring) E1 component subunit alpha [Bacillota bacterium]
MDKKFPIKQIMDGKGNVLDSSYDSQLDEQLLLRMYRHMFRIRTFDRKAIHLQRQGRIGTYPPFEGQEASQVGSALALEDGDWMFPTYRDHGATLTFGANMVRTLLYWNGRVEGCVPPAGKHIFPAAVPIATQIPHAVGASWAEKKKGTDRVAIAYFGDGATSEGDFHEGLNFASVFQTPTIFFNQNNGYAISVPIERQMNSETIAQKGIAYGMRSVRVDGNDCLIVYFETKKAVHLARKGKGPTLIEAVTWRKGAHTTADDPTKYRTENQGKRFIDPLLRLEHLMKKRDCWDEQTIQNIHTECHDEVEAAVKQMEKYPAAKVDDLFDYLYADLPRQLIEQKEAYVESLRGSLHE